ncbi:hypothetical protein [Asticcacaulis taihuensis]|uniref:hypothetical protein n=1 Tax=Asticcacaulis taihuensis TaxID=260084 RepID=UPI0026F1C860|nr:hypothetical protein [Asticcacaulis taihuensis]
MTKLRAPMTAYRALARIVDLIGWDGCASVVGKSEATIRSYSDPDTEREITLRDAMRLDLAYRRAGGHGTPLFEAYAARLEIELRSEATKPAQILHASREAARESGEALDAALSMATGEGDHQEALREVGEAVAAFQGLYTQLQRYAGEP